MANLWPDGFVYKMSALTMSRIEKKTRLLADAGEDEMTRNTANFRDCMTPAAAQAQSLRRALAVYPLRQ